MPFRIAHFLCLVVLVFSDCAVSLFSSISESPFFKCSLGKELFSAQYRSFDLTNVIRREYHIVVLGAGMSVIKQNMVLV